MCNVFMFVSWRHPPCGKIYVNLAHLCGLGKLNILQKMKTYSNFWKLNVLNLPSLFVWAIGMLSGCRAINPQKPLQNLNRLVSPLNEAKIEICWAVMKSFQNITHISYNWQSLISNTISNRLKGRCIVWFLRIWFNLGYVPSFVPGLSNICSQRWQMRMITS